MKFMRRRPVIPRIGQVKLVVYRGSTLLGGRLHKAAWEETTRVKLTFQQRNTKGMTVVLCYGRGTAGLSREGYNIQN